MATKQKPQPTYLQTDEDQPNWDAFNAITDAPVAPTKNDKGRSVGEVLSDTGRGLMSGAAGLVGSAGSLYGLATGDMDNAVSRLGNEGQEYWNAGESDYLKAKKAERSQAIQDADGVIGKAGAAIGGTLKEPALIGDMLAENLASFVPGAVAGRAATAAKFANGLRAASEMGPASMAARAAVEAAAVKTGVAASVGAGAIQQAADVSSDGYHDSMQKTEEQWAQNPVYVKLAQDIGPQAAKQQLALSAARAAFIPAAAISVGANSLPGGQTIERALMGGAAKIPAGSVLKGIGKGIAGEGLSEGIEEGGGKFASNVATQQYVDPNQDLGKDVGENMGMGIAGGMAMGGATGGFHGTHGDEHAHPAPVKAPTPLADTGPLSRAANANSNAIDYQRFDAPMLNPPSPFRDLSLQEKGGNSIDFQPQPAAPAQMTGNSIPDLQDGSAAPGTSGASGASSTQPAPGAPAAAPQYDNGINFSPDSLAQVKAEQASAAAQEVEALTFKSKGLANIAMHRTKTTDTHEVLPDDSGKGFVVRPKYTKAPDQGIAGAGTKILRDGLTAFDALAADGEVSRAHADEAKSILAGLDNNSITVNQAQAKFDALYEAINTPAHVPGDAAAHDVNQKDAPALTANTEQKESEKVPEVAPVVDPIAHVANQAATYPLNDLPQPTEAQKEAGNYKKAHVQVHGLDIAIENPVGSKRSGTDKAGVPWETEMQHHYGYIKGTVGMDKDHIDTFIGTNHDSDKVFVVDQVDPSTGKPDEHKVMLGFDSKEHAHAAYQDNYDAGWTGGKAITETSVKGFKDWLKDGNTKKPFAKQVKEAAPVAESVAPNAAPAAAPVLTKQELNKMTVKDMTDGQLLQAVDVFAGGPRAPKVAKEVKLRGLDTAQAPKGEVIQGPVSEATPAKQENTAPEHANTPDDGPKTEQFSSKAFKDAVAQVRAVHKQWDALMAEHSEWFVGKNKKRKPAPNAPAEVVEVFKSYVKGRDAASETYNRTLSHGKVGVATGNPTITEAVIDDGIVPMTMDAADFKKVTDEWASLFANPENPIRMGNKAAGETLTLEQAAARIADWKDHVKQQAGEYRAENSEKTVLSLFDLTGEWSKPWREAGYNVLTFDIQSGQDVFDFSVEYFTENHDISDVYAILAATPCTDFASSGARHFLEKDIGGQTEQSVALVHQALRTIEYFRPAIWALENPVGRIQNLTGMPDARLSFDPNNFGDPYTKQTQIWGNFNADLPSANVEPTEGSKMHRLYGGKSMATKNARSETPEGFSYAFFMANNYVDMPVETKLTTQYPEASGAIKKALEVGVTEKEIHALMDDTYGNYEFEDARNALIKAVAEKVQDSPPPAPAPTMTPRQKQAEKAKAGAERRATESAQASHGASNKLFTAERAEKARALLKSKLGQINSGIDPEMMMAGIELAGFHIEAGARSFAAYAKAMITDIGEGVRPYLRSYYEGVRHYPGHDNTGMTEGSQIDAEMKALNEHSAPEAEATPAPVIGTKPKADRKTKAADGNAVLTQDFGVDHIDGYQESDLFPSDHTGDSPVGGVKDAFINDSKKYLNNVAALLKGQGFEAHPDGKGRLTKAVSVNEAGPAVSGDVSLAMFNPALGSGVYVTVGGSSLRGVAPSTKSGVAVMMRVTEPGKPFGGDQNRWMETDLTAQDLTNHIQQTVKSVVERQKTDNIDTKNIDEGQSNGPLDTGNHGAQALGDVVTEENTGAEGLGGTERGNSDGSDGRAKTDSGASQPRVSGTRSRGGSTEAVHPSGSGNTGRGRLGGGRVGGERSQVSGNDAGNRSGSVIASAPNVPAKNFRITTDVRLGQGGEVEKFNDNFKAIRLLKDIESENRRATPDEQAMLARYVGWGGLANAFPSPDSGEFKTAWAKRGPELAELLTPKEYSLARRSTLDSHYTSETIVKSMWDAVHRMGYKGGLVLESSMGSGNFIGLIPDRLAGNTKFVGVEYDNLTARIATLLYPQETVINSGFQKVPLSDGSFDLSIGNPPFGQQSLRFQFKPEINGHSIHNQFFLASIDAVKPGGLQVQVVSRYLLDTMDKSARTALAKKAKLLGAIRLPDSAFKENARTEVVTDIVFLQRLMPEEEARTQAAFDAAGSKPERDISKELERKALAKQIPSWVESQKVSDPLGGEPMQVNSYFAQHPEMVMGVLERSGSMQHGNDITVRLDSDKSLSDMLSKAIQTLPENVMVQHQSAIDASIARHQDMSDSLHIALEGHESGSIKLANDGSLQQVIERETPEGDYELAKRTLSAASPWSEQLYQNDKGQWYKIEPVLNADGTAAKMMKDGKPTKRNVYDRKVFESEADIPSGLLLGEAKFGRLKELVNVRDLLTAQLNLEAEDAPGKQIEANRKELATAYKAFVAANGLISDPANSALLSNMPDGALVQALEFSYRPAITKAKAAKIGEKAREASATPAPILSERVIVKYVPPTHAESTSDAISIAMAEAGRVDMDRIASLLGKTVDQVAEEMGSAEKPMLFKDPEQQEWVTRNDYLSGQVKRKLTAARAAGMESNIKALEEVQPEPWGAENVTALLGSTWVPTSVYQDFIAHIAGAKSKVTFSPLTNSFTVNQDGYNAKNEEEWGSDGISSTHMISDLLNNRAVRVMNKNADGNLVVDQERTALALLKARAITNEFGDWVFADSDRRNSLVDIFNDKFNTRVNRQHDGSHLVLPGKVPDAVIAMRRHQKNAIWRGIAERFMLLDHAVGAGKTFTAIARAMERRRMGLSKKPAIIVPNHMVEQFTSDAYRLYPGAKILAAGKADFVKIRRRKLFAKIATGDFDIVIIPHSSFGFIGIAPETEERYLQHELEAAEAAIKDAQDAADENGNTSFRKPFGVKEAERLAEKIRERMDKVKGADTKDRLLTFEQMGIDDLTVDEAHEFKNLFYSSRLTGVKGMGNKTGSQKAFDLYNKVRVLRDSPKGTVTFMTGTPISNSAVEMYTMMRYLAAGELNDLGLDHFDAWRSQFVSTDAGWEPNETGRLKEVNRLGRTWSNMRSLMDLYYSFTDSVSNEDIKKAYAEDNNGEQFPIPKVKDGDRQSVVIQPTEAQLGLLNDIIAQFDDLPNEQDPQERNKKRLRLMDRARKVSLDVRAADPSNKSDEKGGKLEKIADEVLRIYTDWNEDRGTQLIFLDRSVPKAKGDDKVLKEYDGLIADQNQALAKGDEEGLRRVGEKLEKYDANEMEEMRNAQAGGWNAYQQIKDNLVAKGLPANEIRFIQEANNDAQKQAMFDAVNDGSVRVLIGSTPRMGAGTNVQQRLVALHHADVTWKPSDIEQREGRIIRQGNKLLEKYGIDNFEVAINAYATERTIDAKMWSLNSSKLKTINGIRKYDGAFSMEFEDEESVSMAELAALASGDPLLLERVKLMSEIDKLELLKRQHARKEWGIVSQIESAERNIKNLPAGIAETEFDIALLKDAQAGLTEKVAARRVVVEGQTFADYAEAAKEGASAMERQQAGNEKAKFSVSVNGKRYSSPNTFMAAIRDGFGDNAPFEIEIGKDTFTSRTDASRHIAELVSDAARDLTDGGSKVIDLGSFLGMKLEAIAQRGQYNSQFSATLAVLRPNGSTIASMDSSNREKHEFTTQAIQPVLRELDNALDAEYRESGLKSTKERLAKAQEELPDLLAKRGAGFPQQAELDQKNGRLEEVIQSLSEDKPAATEAPQVESEAMGRHSKLGRSMLDMALFSDVASGVSATDVLTRIANESDNPGHREIAAQLISNGVNPTVGYGSSKGESFSVKGIDASEFAASYSLKKHHVALYQMADAEANLVHEMVHAGTAQALRKGGRAALQMQALYADVKRSGQLAGEYGMANLDEFVAEAHSDPIFQAKLKAIKLTGSKYQTMWQRFVDVVRNALGLPVSQLDALRHALEVGRALMGENGNNEQGAKNGEVMGNIRNSSVGQAYDVLRGANTLSEATASVKELLSSEKQFGLLNRTVGTQFHKATKNEAFKRVFTAYNNQTDDTAHYAIESEKLAPDVLQRLDGFADVGRALLNSGGKYKADLDAISKPLFSNIEGESGVQQNVYSTAELAQEFGLNDKQIEMYKQVRLAVDASLERLAQTTIVSMAEAAQMDTAPLKNLSLEETVRLVKEGTDDGYIGKNIAGMTKQSDLHSRIDDIVAQTSKLQEAGYMPAMRFGNYAVTVQDPSPSAAGDNVLHFEMFESQMKANIAAKKLANKYPGMAVSKSIMNQDRFKMFKGVSPETVELFAKFSGMDKDAAYKDYIALAKSGRSTTKRMLERKGVAGFSDDVTRVLASFITSNGRQSAMNMNAGEITSALASKELAKHGDVQREAQLLHEYMSNPQEEAQRLRGFMFINFIGGSIASAAVNLTQPILQTGPYLSQFAGTKTAGILAAAGKMAATGKITNAELNAAMARAKSDGITDPHEIHNLMADASGSTLGTSLRMRAITKAWGSFFSVSEALNRRLTFLAAYQTAMSMGQEELTAKGFKDAYEFSRQAIIETQGLYSKTNRPNWARGAVGATLFTFKQFSISYVEFLSRLPNKQKAIALGILILAAGFQGLPFMEDLQDLIDTIGQSMGYNTNTKRSWRQAAINVLGKDLGEIFANGLSSQSNVDLQGRLGMGNLLPGTALFKMSEKDKSSSMAEFLGPIGGVLKSAQDAVGKAQSGEILGKTGALATMAPAAVRNLLQGAESASTGVYTDTKGRKVQDIGNVASVLKSLGFQPIEIAQESRKMSDIMQDKGMLTAVSSAISSRWAEAAAVGDNEGTKAAMDTLRAWNANNPETTISINPASIVSRVRQIRSTRAERFIKSTPKSMKARTIEELA